MREVISVCNRKGGVGKSTIAVCLAVGYAYAGKEVVLIDTDPQASSSGFRTLRMEKEDLPQFAAAKVHDPVLHKDLKNLAFDICIIDAAGGESEMQRNAMRVSDLIVIPSAPSGFELWASEDTFKKVRELREFKPHAKAVAFYNLCRPGGTLLMEEALVVQKDFERDYGVPFLKKVLYNREAYRKATTNGLGIQESDDRKARDEFQDFFNEIDRLVMK